MSISNKQIFRKIPIIITKWNDGNINGWRAEIADNYESYKPTRCDEINFEDLGFHFFLPYENETHELDQYVFLKKKFAVMSAKEIVEKLNGKAKIWHV